LWKRAGAAWWEGAVMVAAVAWLSALVAAPYAVSHRDAGDFLFRAGAAVYVAGSLVCHQDADRSFHLWRVQLPVCGRCTGIYSGAVVGAILALIASRSRTSWRGSPGSRLRPGRFRTVIVLGSLPVAVSVVMEWAGWRGQSTAWRAATGLPLGLVVAWLVAGAARDR
jgi:uncharacterized membrane protein